MKVFLLVKYFSKHINFLSVFLCPPQNCGWALRFALLRTTRNLLYATPSTPLDGFCSYPYIVTNMTWR